MLLEEVPSITTSPGGLIVIPDSAQQKFNQGIVVELGPDVPEPTLYCKGDIVVFPLHSEYRVKHNNKSYILVHSSELMARISDDKKKAKG